MKKLFSAAVIGVFYVFTSHGVQAQTPQTPLDQLKLAQAFVGNWQTNLGKDTIDGWELHQYGKAFIESGYLIIKGKKSFNYEESYLFSPKDGKFKGFVLYHNGNYMTWIGLFTSEKKMEGNIIQDFNPATITGRFEALIETSNKITFRFLNPKGEKTGENSWTKVK
jgi:hypothetical protein